MCSASFSYLFYIYFNIFEEEIISLNPTSFYCWVLSSCSILDCQQIVLLSWILSRLIHKSIYLTLQHSFRISLMQCKCWWLLFSYNFSSPSISIKIKLSLFFFFFFFLIGKCNCRFSFPQCYLWNPFSLGHRY